MHQVHTSFLYNIFTFSSLFKHPSPLIMIKYTIWTDNYLIFHCENNNCQVETFQSSQDWVFEHTRVSFCFFSVFFTIFVQEVSLIFSMISPSLHVRAESLWPYQKLTPPLSFLIMYQKSHHFTDYFSIEMYYIIVHILIQEREVSSDVQ